MSSIYGKLNFDKSPVGVDNLIPIENALNHWGADDKGIWYKDSVALGHLMLYITPESLHEKLPLSGNNNRLTITADARIDNRDELFNKLDFAGQETHRVPDSLLILKAYEKYGEECVKHLIGDFSFAIWDENEQKLFCARDHTGVKPFFYYKDDHFFAFASEARGLLAIKGLNQEINEDYFLKSMTQLQPLKKETAYKYIFRLNVAHSLTVKNGTIQFVKYWELDANKEIIYEDKEQYLDKFRELFTEAVRCRLRSNYLIGTELSGGLDSGGIAAVAANLLHQQGKKIAAFVSVSAPRQLYKDENIREEVYADEVIKFSGIDFVEKKITDQTKGDFLKEIDDRLSVYGYPPKVPMDWNRWLYKSASGMQVRTMLSGHGGDQLVTDYGGKYIFDYFNNKKYKTYFKLAINKWGIRRAFINIIEMKMKHPAPLIVKKLMVGRKIKEIKQSPTNFLAPDYFHRVKSHINFTHFPSNFKEVQKNKISVDFVGDRMEFETLLGLQFKLCPVFPMMDIRLMEFVLAVPTEEKIQPGKRRWLYRRAMQDLMPEKVVNRKTKHVSPTILQDQVKWLSRQGEVKDWIMDLQKKNQLPPFIKFDKLMEGYTMTADKLDAADTWLLAKRKQIEVIMRWFEKMN